MSKNGFELRLRKDSPSSSSFTRTPNSTSSSGQSNRSASKLEKPKSFRDKLSNSAIICVCILLLVTVLKMVNSEKTNSALETFSRLVNSQTDFEETANDVVGFFTDAYSDFIGKEVSVVSPADISIAPPLESGTIVKEFVNEVHPVFSTIVTPRGVRIQTEPSSFVLSSCDGEVAAVFTNEDETRRIVVSYSKTMTVVYDNISVCYVNEGSSVKTGDILGVLSEGDPVLAFEIWINSDAVDPLEYLGSSYQ